MYESAHKNKKERLQYHYILEKCSGDLVCIHNFFNDKSQATHLNEFNYPLENIYNDQRDEFMIWKANKIFFLNSLKKLK